MTTKGRFARGCSKTASTTCTVPERILPVTRLRALALEVGPEADHAVLREFLTDVNAR
jgi:hypothetical protein